MVINITPTARNDAYDFISLQYFTPLPQSLLKAPSRTRELPCSLFIQEGTDLIDPPNGTPMFELKNGGKIVFIWGAIYISPLVAPTNVKMCGAFVIRRMGAG